MHGSNEEMLTEHSNVMQDIINKMGREKYEKWLESITRSTVLNEGVDMEALDLAQKDRKIMSRKRVPLAKKKKY